jgi:uncharacterized membrane protein (DUF4010 family)
MEVFNFVVSIFLGALIGLQREFTQQKVHLKKFAGFRTFILITFFGAILGYLGGSVDSLLVLIGFAGVFLLTLLSYVLTYMRDNITSATTEVSAIMCYILGVMCVTGYVQLAVIFGILIAAFLTFKEKFHQIAKKMKGKEFVAVIKFALISLVVLPILPNKNFSPMDVPGLRDILLGFNINPTFLSQLDIFNFYHIWLMVVFIAAINFLGYFLIKMIGSKKGYGILGFVGGLVSSTAVTLSMAGESKQYKVVFPFVLATVIATSVMFVRVIFEVAVVNSSLLTILLMPLGTMALVGFGLAFLFYRRGNKSQKKAKEIEIEQPFALKPALKFGLFFLLVLFVSKITQLAFGQVGIYATSVLSGLADVDAITLSMASLSKSGSVTDFVATTSIILATASNTLVKAGMALMLGNKKFGKIILGIFLAILLVGLSVLFF